MKHITFIAALFVVCNFSIKDAIAQATNATNNQTLVTEFLGWDAAGSLYLWSISLAFLASVGGALAWTFAAKRLPVALSAQLIVSETVFGTIFGLAVHGRWPTPTDILGIVFLVAGVVTAIRVFHGERKLAAVA